MQTPAEEGVPPLSAPAQGSHSQTSSGNAVPRAAPTPPTLLATATVAPHHPAAAGDATEGPLPAEDDVGRDEAELAAELAAAQARLEQLRGEHAAQGEETKRNGAELKDARHKGKRAEKDEAEWRRKIDEKGQQMKELESQQHVCRDNMVMERGRGQTLRDSQEQLELRLRVADEQAAATATQMAQLNEELGSSQAEVAERETRVKALRGRLGVSQREKRVLAGQEGQLREEVTALQERVVALRQQSEDLSTECKKVQGLHQDLQARCSGVVAGNETSRDEMRQCVLKVAEMRRMLEASKISELNKSSGGLSPEDIHEKSNAGMASVRAALKRMKRHLGEPGGDSDTYKRAQVSMHTRIPFTISLVDTGPLTSRPDSGPWWFCWMKLLLCARD
jgi:chromosome segregation ATPase